MKKVKATIIPHDDPPLNNFLSVRGIPADLKHRFKIACITERKTIYSVVKELMESYIEMVGSKKK